MFDTYGFYNIIIIFIRKNSNSDLEQFDIFITHYLTIMHYFLNETAFLYNIRLFRIIFSTAIKENKTDNDRSLLLEHCVRISSHFFIS